MNITTRERLAWLLACVMLAGLALRLNGSFAARDDDYNFVRTLIDVHRQVSRNYVDAVDEDKLRQGAIDGMLAQLDPYTNYIPPAKAEAFNQQMGGQIKGIGVELQADDDGNIKVVIPIDGSPAQKAGVLAGDVIVRVNGQDVKGQKIDEVRERILKGPPDVALRVRRDGQEIDLPPMTRAKIDVPSVRGFRRMPDGRWDWYLSRDQKVAYVRVSQFTSQTPIDLTNALNPLVADGMRGLVLDLRFNPGGLLPEAAQVCDLFLKEGVIVSTRGRNQPEQVYRAEADGTLPDFPMVVLVNEDSASASEIVAGALQDNKRATVVGERSFGKGSVQTIVDLGPRQGELKITVAHYYLPSGRLVHKKEGATEWGVEPTIKVPMTTDQKRRMAQAMAEGYSTLNKPVTRAATRPTANGTTLPTTAPSATTNPSAPTTGPAATATTTPTVETLADLDPQLDAALKEIASKLASASAAPPTQPATAPAVVKPPPPAEPGTKPVTK
ncbi:MAG TPA: S41 family peptidase [Humisphaera sp.]